MITAYATVENAVAAFQRGAHDYLMKPVMFEELLAKIDRLMKYRRLLAREPGPPAAVPRPRRPRDAGRAEPGDAGGQDADPQGRPDAEHRPDHRRIGHGQGAGGPGAPHVRARPRRGLPGRQLRGDPPRPAGEPALRPRPGLVHRRRSRPRRAVRRRGAGDRLPRRDRRAVAGRPRPSCSGPSRTRKCCPSARPDRSRFRPGW